MSKFARVYSVSDVGSRGENLATPYFLTTCTASTSMQTHQTAGEYYVSPSSSYYHVTYVQVRQVSLNSPLSPECVPDHVTIETRDAGGETVTWKVYVTEVGMSLHTHTHTLTETLLTTPGQWHQDPGPVLWMDARHSQEQASPQTSTCRGEEVIPNCTVAATPTLHYRSVTCSTWSDCVSATTSSPPSLTPSPISHTSGNYCYIKTSSASSPRSFAASPHWSYSGLVLTRFLAFLTLSQLSVFFAASILIIINSLSSQSPCAN